MLHLLLDNVLVQVGGEVFQQCVRIPMGKNCGQLLAELLLHDFKGIAISGFRGQMGIHKLNHSSSLTDI